MERLLRASFVRVRGQRDRIYVHRSDGSEVSWVFPSYGDGLPHDLVHLVVESAFGLKSGFWGRVNAGVDPARVNDEANRAGGPDKYRGFGEDRREILVAEGLAAAPWWDAEASDASVCEGIRASWVSVGLEAPEAATPERVRETREALARFSAQWRELGKKEKGTVTLAFRPDDPRRGFEEAMRVTASRGPPR